MIESINQVVNSWALQSLNSYLAYPFYFTAGLLGSLFPCVYPLYPVTAGFLRNRARNKEASWRHPLLYWLGMVLAYTLLGILAALSGGAFNSLMQSGIVIVLLGFLFLFLAFVSLDWFHLHWNLGQSWVQRIIGREGSLFTFLMGNLAGLVASACVAPVLVSMLVLLAQNSTGNALYRVWQGGSLCLAFGGGIGLPFFITGVLGARLPRSGVWQLFVKYAFALAIALAALYQIQKGFETMGWSAEQIYLILGAMFLLFLAVFYSNLAFTASFAKDRHSQTKLYFALLALAFSFAMLTRSFVYPGNAELPKISKKQIPIRESKPTQEYETVGPLRFYRDPDFALQLAQKKKSPVFIDFYADWCANCKDFTRLVNKDKALQSILKKAVLVKIYDTDPAFRKYSQDPRFPELRIGLPFFVVLEANGKLRWKTTDYRDTSGMGRAIREAAAAAPTASIFLKGKK